jgi:hypothetical protein
MKSLIGALIGATALFGATVLGEADERVQAGASVNPTLLINNVLGQPVDHQQRQIAFDESLRQPGPTPANRTTFNGEVQPDGSVRYGDVTVSTLKNPCPPGEHVELPSPPLPRRARK